MTTPVDVLIIDAGASEAVMAWSLTEIKAHILCQEQGDREIHSFNDFNASRTGAPGRCC